MEGQIFGEFRQSTSGVGFGLWPGIYRLSKGQMSCDPEIFLGELQLLELWSATGECTTGSVRPQRDQLGIPSLFCIFGFCLQAVCNTALRIPRPHHLTTPHLRLPRHPILTMRFLLPRALSTGRQALLQKPAFHASLAQRCSFLPAVQIAPASFKTHAGYKPNPSETPVNPNVRNKIHEKKRPIKRPFVPPPTKTEEELTAALPYIIRRTPYAQLPIYRKFMSGGNRCIILIKKIDGDRSKLVEDLTVALELQRKDIRLNPTTQQIEIKVSDNLVQNVRVRQLTVYVGELL